MEDNVKEYRSRKQTLKSVLAVIVHCCQRSRRKKERKKGRKLAKKEKNWGNAGRREEKRTYTRTKEKFYLVKWIAAITSRYRISFARSLPQGEGVQGSCWE